MTDLTAEPSEATEAAWRAARDAAVAVAALIPGATSHDDGGGEYVLLPGNHPGAEPPIAYVLPPGEGAEHRVGRWSLFDVASGHLIESEHTPATPAAEVATWCDLAVTEVAHLVDTEGPRLPGSAR